MVKRLRGAFYQIQVTERYGIETAGIYCNLHGNPPMRFLAHCAVKRRHRIAYIEALLLKVQRLKHSALYGLQS
jgi:hypothetical protein